MGGTMNNENNKTPFVKEVKPYADTGKHFMKGEKRNYVVSFDGRTFYQVFATNEKQALEIAMSIGVNPRPRKPPPPSPGKHVVKPSGIKIATLPKNKKVLKMKKKSMSLKAAVRGKINCNLQRAAVYRLKEGNK